jgi:isochorismate synthase
MAICNPDEAIEISDISQIPSELANESFIAFPFNSSGRKGFILPNTLLDFFSISENLQVEETQVDKNWDSCFATSPAYYKMNVEAAVEEIKNGSFEKLVVARKKEFILDGFDHDGIITDLVELYPNAHLSVFRIFGQGLWISVSPEIIVEKGKNEPEIRTMALAGTRVFDGTELKAQGWTEKEIEEQSLVTRYIQASLKDSGHKKFVEKGPYTNQAGSLIHLKTDFSISENSDKSFWQILAKLHPTSAVCGSPKDKAYLWLEEREGFDREFFSGFCGIAGKNYGKLVVILRACCIKGNKLSLYAGAGITAFSNPELEWRETEEKMKTLRRVFNC